MRANDSQSLSLQEGDARQHRFAEHGVCLHAPPLGGTQRSRFQKNSVGDPDLADVVQQESVRRARIFVDPRLTDVRGERECVALHALRMCPRSGVFRFEGAGERGDGLHVRALQQLALSSLELQHVAQVARVQEQLFVRPGRALFRRAERHAVETAGQSFRNSQQFERTERLAHERVRTGLLRRSRGASVRTREEHDRDVTRCRIAFQLATELEAAHSGHVHVEEDDARAIAPDRLSGCTRVVRLHNVDIRDLERRLQQRAERRIVVDEQDPQDARPPFPVPGSECRQLTHDT